MIRTAYRILVVIFRGSLGRPRKRREDDIKMYLIEPCWGDVDCVRLAEIMKILMIVTMKLNVCNLACFPDSDCCLGLTILPVDTTAGCDSDSDLVLHTVTL
jgi:hypothetical protein